MPKNDGVNNLSLPDALMKRCRVAFLRCNKFQSAQSLRTVFAWPGLGQYQLDIPDAAEPTDRVDKTLLFLLNKGQQDGGFVFLRFLHALQSMENDGDELCGELGECHAEVERIFSINKLRRSFATLSSEQWEMVLAIAQHFFQCLSLHNPDQRARIFSKYALVTATSVQDEYGDYANILARVVPAYLSSFSTPFSNNIEKLTEIVYEFEGDSHQWIELDKFLCQLFGRVVSPTRWHYLLTILKQVQWPPQILKQAYTRCLPIGWFHSRIREQYLPQLLEQILKDLAKIPHQSNNTFPFLEFTGFLLYIAKQNQWLQTATDLDNWIDTCMTALNFSHDQRLQLHQRVLEQSDNALSYLLVTLERISPDLFGLSAWLFNSDNRSHVAGIEHNYSEVEQDQIVDILNELLGQCEEQIEEPKKNLIVEFFLPNELLYMNVYNWPVTGESVPLSLGIAHNVVVRSFDRARHKKRSMFIRWQKKWQLLQDFIDDESLSIDKGEFIEIRDEKQCPEPIIFFVALEDARTVCFAFKFEPFIDPSTIHYGLETVLNSGVPIILWLRGKKFVEQDALWLQSLLSRELLPLLPQRVHEERRKALISGDKQHPGHFVTLLWDDPNRLPPNIVRRPLSMPLARR